MDKSMKSTPAKCVEQLAISQAPEKAFNFNAIFKPKGLSPQSNPSQSRNYSLTAMRPPQLAQPKLVVSTHSHQPFPTIATWAKKSPGPETNVVPESSAFVHAILVYNITSDVMTTVSDRAQRLECYTVDVGPDVDSASRIFRFFDARHAAKFQGGLIKNPWFKNIQAQSHYDPHLNVMVFSVSSNLWPQIENDMLRILKTFGDVCLLQRDPANMMNLPESMLVANQETIVCKFWDMRNMHKLQSTGSIGLESGLILTPVCVSVNPLSLQKLSQIWNPLSTPPSTIPSSIPPPTPQLMPQVMSPLTPVSFSLDKANSLPKISEHQMPKSPFQPLNTQLPVSDSLAFSSAGQVREALQRQVSENQMSDRNQLSFQGNSVETNAVSTSQESETKLFSTNEPTQPSFGISQFNKSYPFSDVNSTSLNRQHNATTSFESRKLLNPLGNAMPENQFVQQFQSDYFGSMNQKNTRLGSGSLWQEFTPQTAMTGNRNAVISEAIEQQSHHSSIASATNGSLKASNSHLGHRYGTVDSVSSISSVSSIESQANSDFADECAALFKRFGITRPVNWPVSPPPSPPLKQATPVPSRRARRTQQAQPSFLKYDATNGPPDQLETHIDLGAIENGTEKRCTVMVRNIPNKLEFDEFKAFMDATSQGCYDFLYLRFDFTNRCNVGYAFVSFTDPKYVKEFVQKRSGMNWKELNHNSGKVVDLRYAKIQGHYNLVQKFRNSPVMTQEQSFRPRFYHTSGPLKGKEIEFDSTP